jgi:preprotein translocase subunit SecA
MYGKLSGITGTARGAKEELRLQYGLPVVEIPTHKDVARIDEPDRHYPHPAPRLLAAVADIGTAHAKGQPVLVSTISVNASKHVSKRLQSPLLCFSDVILSSPGLFRLLAPMISGGKELLAREGQGLEKLGADVHRLLLADQKGQKAVAQALEARGLPGKKILELKEGIVHRTLNAETHEQEAEILSIAGRKGAVTVATQMAGRGVDIPLGEGVAALGGLRVVGIEHKTNRRKDDQARGRAGRQGQPGSSVFYVSPADEVFSYLPAHKLRDLCTLLPADKIVPAERGILAAWNDAIDGAQQRAELNGEAERRRSVKLDRVLEIQRGHVKRMREEILEYPKLAEELSSWLHEKAEKDVDLSKNFPIAFTCQGLMLRIEPGAQVTLALNASAEESHAALEAAIQRRMDAAKIKDGKDDDGFNQYLRDMVLYNLDSAWIGHQLEQEQMKSTAYLAAFADKDPAVEHTIQACKDFRQMQDAVKAVITSRFIFSLSQV